MIERARGRRKLLGRVFFIFIASIAIAGKVHAACEIGGMSGTGVAEPFESDPGTGAGGTGFGKSGETGGTGSGGTGHSDPGDSGTGSGGTGILGIVTGFGSVCINGVEVEYDDSTRIEKDGRPAGTGDLAIGQLARITTHANRPLHAQDIRVESALIGPVDRVDSAGGRLWVMGQPVELGDGGRIFDQRTGRVAAVEKVERGSFVAVSGLRRGDGVVSATRVELGGARDRTIATAVVTEVARDRIYLGDLRAEVVDRGTSSPQSLGGRRVRVTGSWNERTQTLERASVEPAAAFDRDVHRVSLQGHPIAGRGEETFRIQGTTVEASSLRDQVLDLPVDSIVRVEGRVDEPGRVRAERIVVEKRGRSSIPFRMSSDAVEGRSGRGDRSDRQGRTDRGDRSGREGRADRADRPERPERPERSGRSERPERSGR